MKLQITYITPKKETVRTPPHPPQNKKQMHSQPQRTKALLFIIMRLNLGFVGLIKERSLNPKFKHWADQKLLESLKLGCDFSPN